MSFARKAVSALNVISRKTNVGAITFATFSKSSQPNLIVGLTSKSKENSAIFIAVASDFRVQDKFKYNASLWKGPFVIPNVETMSGIVGVAFDHIRGPQSNDLLILYMRHPREMEYVIGFGITFTSSQLVAQKWSRPFAVPAKLTNLSATSVSVKFLTMRGNRKDLIIAFERGNKVMSYAIGRNIDSRGSALRGWARSGLLPSPKSIFPNSLPVLQIQRNENMVNLIFGKRLGKFHISLRVGEGIKNAGLYSKRMVIPPNNINLKNFLSLVDIFASANSSGQDVVPRKLSQRRFAAPSFPYRRDIYFGSRRNSKLIPDQKRNHPPVNNKTDSCLKCYGDAGLQSCIERVTTCKPVETQTQNISQVDGNTKNYSNFESTHIFCYGFNAILNNQTEDICKKTYTTEYMFSAGMAVILQENLDADFTIVSAGDSPVNVTMSISYNSVPVFNAFTGTLSTVRPPNSVSIRIRSQHTLRAQIINQAILKLRRKSDFRSFLNGNWGVRKIGDNVFLVSFTFSSKFQNQYEKNPGEVIF